MSKNRKNKCLVYLDEVGYNLFEVEESRMHQSSPRNTTHNVTKVHCQVIDGMRAIKTTPITFEKYGVYEIIASLFSQNIYLLTVHY